MNKKLIENICHIRNVAGIFLIRLKKGFIQYVTNIK